MVSAVRRRSPELAKRGTSLALLGRPSRALDETADVARRTGVRVESVPCDLANAEDDARRRKGARKYSTPVGIVNNAAVIRRAPIELMTRGIGTSSSP